MPAGEAFTKEQSLRLERAALAASGQTGLRFAVLVGGLDGRTVDAAATEWLGRLAGPGEAVVLVLVAPEERLVRVATTAAARERVSDQACALATLSMTTSFGVGDLTGGIVSGLRMLADAAGRVAAPGSASFS